jgi:proteasome lid subunit RPN8/RPN11
MLKIPKSMYNEIVEHARSLEPIESCGYLAGKDNEMKLFIPMTNIDNRADHFSFDQKEMFAALKAARAEGLQLTAVYHSHPETPARFSEEDKRLLIDPSMTYLIMSLMNPEEDLKAFRLGTDGPEQVDIEYLD